MDSFLVRRLLRVSDLAWIKIDNQKKALKTPLDEPLRAQYYHFSTV